jgi:hypothetical protein
MLPSSNLGPTDDAHQVHLADRIILWQTD